MTAISRVAIVAKPGAPTAAGTARELARQLEQAGCQVLLEGHIARELGAALAAETKAKSAHVLLAPTVNLHRHPLAGRNFECMAEDPELTARLAAALIAGLQAGGVGACIKHFVANDQETDRHTIDALVDERTLREVYLRPFEAAIAEADPWTVMAAFRLPRRPTLI